MIWIILIAVYLVSAYLTWLWIHIAQSKGGSYEGINTSFKDLFVTICPVVNTMFSLIGWLFYFPYSLKSNYNKFFKIKK